MSTQSFHRFALSVLCCASTGVLVACGGGSTADTASATGATQTSPQGSADAQTTVANNGDAAQTPAASPAVPSAGTTPATAPSAPASTPATSSPPSQPAAASPYGQNASAYTLTFSEEFNSYNSSVWNDHIWYEGSDATKNYTVENGALKIWPQRNASGNFVNRTIDTDGKYYQTYGYFEMEAKLPKGKGTWPAFWLLNHDQAAPYRPEIDILEAYAGGGPNSGWSDSALNPTTYAATVWPDGIDGGPGAGSKMIQNLGDLSSGFHKYGAKWEPNKITFYYDGKEVYSVNASMNNRMYILLDLWYGSASGNPDNTTPTGKTNSFEVNYVRAWQFK